MTRSPTRRRILQRSAASLLILPSSRSAFSFQANDRLNLAIIGVSGYASAAAFVPAIHIYDNVSISALCDVDQRKVAPAFKLWDDRARAWPTSSKPEEKRGADHYVRLAERHPPLFQDYRVMFDKASKDFDAVVVATPDHTHAPASAAALRAGKHVLAEKPLTITAHESRALHDLTLQSRLATSMGNQGTQSGPFRRGVELIRDGTLGEIQQVHIWFDRGGQNHKEAPKGPQPIPPELNWDLWLGSIAWREYHPNWIARTHWRDTSTGELGNFFPHTANLAFMGLNIADLWKREAGSPRISVEAECSNVNRISFPTWERIRWAIPARGPMPPVTFTWHQGPGLPPGSRDQIEKLLRDHGATHDDVKKLLLYAGAILVASKGLLVTDSHNVNVTLLPKNQFADVNTTRPTQLPSSRGHYRDWLHACRGGDTPWANFLYASRFNELLTLGDIATRFPDSRLKYDPRPGRIINHPEAHAALSYEYRQGFRL